MITRLLLLALLSSPALAAPGAVDVRPPLRADSPELAVDPGVRVSDEDWRDAVRARAIVLWRAEPQLAEAIATEPLPTTRGGAYRVGGKALLQPGATEVLLDRLLYAEEDEAIRGALALAVAPRIDELAVVDTLLRDPHASVRVGAASGLRARTDGAQLLIAALADPEPRVRATAVRSTLHRADAATFATHLVPLTRDASADVRAAAARALGVLGHTAAWADVAALLTDPTATVRLEAVDALGRMDRDRARAAVQPLVNDADTDVAAAAGRIVD